MLFYVKRDYLLTMVFYLLEMNDMNKRYNAGENGGYKNEGNTKTFVRYAARAY